MTKALVRVHREEDGQVMLLALITAVFLVLVMAFPLNVGWTISKRLRLQNAADAAAYSAAVVQADGLSAIAWLNNAMSWCYQRQYGLALKFSTYGVYAQLERWGDEKGVNKPTNEDYDLDGVDWYKDFKDKIKGKTPIHAFTEFLGSEARLINRDRNSYSAERRTLEMWTRMLRIAAEEIARRLPDMMRFEAMRIAYIDTYDGTVGNNPGKNQVYMAFFPDENSDPVQLRFAPCRDAGQYVGDLSTDNSFMQYERWNSPYDQAGDSHGCRFVERAMQIAADQNAFFMNTLTGRLNTPEIGDHHIIGVDGKLNLSSIDDQAKPWFNEYDGEPRKDGGHYLSFAKTVVCWHPDDKAGQGGHGKPDKTPCGHWHPQHTHLHFNCVHTDSGETHTHTAVSMEHKEGFEKNHWCLVESREIRCPKWFAPPPGCGDVVSAVANPSGLSPLRETRVNESVLPGSEIDATFIDRPSPGKGDGDDAKWHHAIHYCPLCFTKKDDANREFPDSQAADDHGLAYSRSHIYKPTLNERADHEFSLSSQPDGTVEPVKGKKKSMVRAYLEDVLTDAYSSPWFDFKRVAAFQQIHKSNYSPEVPAPAPGKINAKLCPTIIFKPVDNPTDNHNFFNWGITVALWQRHHSIMFRKYTTNEGGGGVFAEMEGMLAIASAKTGIRVQKKLYGDQSGRKGATRYFPERIICGIGEKSRAGEPNGPYDAAYMHQQFLTNRDRKEPLLNLFHTDWGARLIPIQKSVPAAQSAIAAKFVLAQTNRIYSYGGPHAPPNIINERIAANKWTNVDVQGWTDEEWMFLTQLLVH